MKVEENDEKGKSKDNKRLQKFMIRPVKDICRRTSIHPKKIVGFKLLLKVV